VITDENGNVVEEQKNLPFGELISWGERYGFTGKEFEPDLGLNYFGARYYDPVTGRFRNVDSVKDGVNWYSYANNNPLKYVDPDGNQVEWVGPTEDFWKDWWGIHEDLIYRYTIGPISNMLGVKPVTGPIMKPESYKQARKNEDGTWSFYSKNPGEEIIILDRRASGEVQKTNDDIIIYTILYSGGKIALKVGAKMAAKLFPKPIVISGETTEGTTILLGTQSSTSTASEKIMTKTIPSNVKNVKFDPNFMPFKPNSFKRLIIKNPSPKIMTGKVGGETCAILKPGGEATVHIEKIVNSKITPYFSGEARITPFFQGFMNSAGANVHSVKIGASQYTLILKKPPP